MDALISIGREFALVKNDDGTFARIHFSDPDKLIPTFPHDMNFLMDGAEPFIRLDNTDMTRLKEQIVFLSDMGDVAFLSYIIKDPSTSDGIRQESSEEISRIRKKYAPPFIANFEGLSGLSDAETASAIEIERFLAAYHEIKTFIGIIRPVPDVCGVVIPVFTNNSESLFIQIADLKDERYFISGWRQLTIDEDSPLVPIKPTHPIIVRTGDEAITAVETGYGEFIYGKLTHKELTAKVVADFTSNPSKQKRNGASTPKMG